MTVICQGSRAAAGAMVEVDNRVNLSVHLQPRGGGSPGIVGRGRISGSDARTAPSAHDGRRGISSYIADRKRPGAMIFLGNGDTASLHNPAYDFNDEITVRHLLLGEAGAETDCWPL